MLAALGRSIDGVLRGEPLPATELPRATLPRLIAFIVLFGVFYGAVMGSFGVTSIRLLQPLYSGVKVPLLLLVTFLLSLPSFWVLNTLLGLAADFREVLRALVTTQAALTVILASLAPFTVFWYASFTDYHNAILFNGVMFGIASFSAQWLLRRLYRPLIARNIRHRTLLRVWLIIYAFVGIQLGYVLRPFIGDPRLPVHFFRADSWGNAYVYVAQLIWHALTGRGLA
jgi:hypothetical protein